MGELKRVNRGANAAVRPYQRVGGVFQFAFFDGADDEGRDALAAIELCLSKFGPVDKGALATLTGRRISETQFFGDWYDPSDGNLVWRGQYSTDDGRTLTNPKAKDFKDTRVTSSGHPGVEVGEGGQFAYAFLNPPYGLSAPRSKIERLFSGIKDVILPPGEACLILDWTHPNLDEVSRCFEAGKEWWGIFLFSIFIPEKQQITIIMASATD